MMDSKGLHWEVGGHHGEVFKEVLLVVKVTEGQYCRCPQRTVRGHKEI